MLKNLSLRHLIPMLLLSGGLLFVLFFYGVSFPAAKKHADQLSLQVTHTLLQSQQGRLSELLASNDRRTLEKELYYTSTDPGTRRILILDEENMIMYANRSRLVGSHITESGLPVDLGQLNRMLLENSIILSPTNDNKTLIGYAPLNVSHNDQRRVFRLILLRDYRSLSDSVATIVAYPSEMLTTFLVLASLLAIVILRNHLDTRMYPLLNAAARLSRGEKNVRASLSGSDEFSEIGNSFDQMASRIDAHTVELENAKDNAEKANTAKNHFLSHMSHEIQTPVATIMGFLDLLKDTQLDSDASLYIRNMETATRTLSHLVDDLLETSRLEAGTITPNPHAFCLNTVTQETIESLLPHARDKGLAVKITSNDSDPIWIDSDARIFRQIFLNLIGNSILYTEEGSITVVIEASPAGKEERTLQISVVDTGIGIHEKDLPHIFDRFYRSDDRRVREQKGAGIGLTICNDFARILQGELQVETSLGIGTSFIFNVKVPTAQPEIDFDFADLSMREQESLDILLVEHTPAMQVLFRSILEKAGHKVEVCSNAQAAMKHVKDRIIYPHLPVVSLIIMDLHLPKTDGFQLVKEIRQLGGNFSEVPILATSTLDDQAIQDQCLENGFGGFITKPVNKQYLIEEIFRLTRMSVTEEMEPTRKTGSL